MGSARLSDLLARSLLNRSFQFSVRLYLTPREFHFSFYSVQFGFQNLNKTQNWTNSKPNDFKRTILKWNKIQIPINFKCEQISNLNEFRIWTKFRNLEKIKTEQFQYRTFLNAKKNQKKSIFNIFEIWTNYRFEQIIWTFFRPEQKTNLHKFRNQKNRQNQQNPKRNQQKLKKKQTGETSQNRTDYA
jgi:hypothetical protein